MRDAKNNGRAVLNEKPLDEYHNDEDNMNVSIKVLVIRKRMQVLLLMISNVFHVVKVAIRYINVKNM